MFLKILLIVLVSMLPLIELRGAIPIAVGMGIELPEWAILIIAVIGNLIPIPIIYFFARKFLEWGNTKKWKPLKKSCEFFLKKGEKAGEKLLKKTGEYGTFIALLLFVAIPLPGTGAWTGTLAASILDLGFKKTVISVSLGVLIAGIIMLLASLGLFRGILA